MTTPVSAVALKRNYIYNLIISILFQTFLLVTLPYASRLFGPTTLGKITFSLSFINFFILPVLIGVPFIGIREIAKAKNQQELNKTFSNLLFINILLCVGSFVAYLAFFLIFDRMQQDFLLYSVLGIVILGNLVNVKWFFQGLEQYEFITFAMFVTTLVSTISVFLFVKNTSDYILYILFWTLSIIVFNILTFVKATQQVDLHLQFDMSCFKSLGVMFLAFLIIQVYCYFDTLLLGLLTSDYYVGLYTPALRFVDLGLILGTSLNPIMIPRLAHYVRERNDLAFTQTAHSSLRLIYLIAIPIALFLVIFANPIIQLTAGSGYEGSVSVLRILAFIIPFAGFNTLFGLQILNAHNEERYFLYSAFIGLFISVSLNIWLIPIIQHVGVAIARFATEGVILVINYWYARKYITFPVLPTKKYLIALALVLVLYSGLTWLISNLLLQLLAAIFLGVLIYISTLILLNEETITIIQSAF